jgi:branched-chain amino acid transport system ATP-binding protein
MSLLEVAGLTAGYGLLVACQNITFSLQAGEVLALVGANGAGKTTLLRCLAGAHRPSHEQIRFAGADIAGVPAHQRTAQGIALVPEGRRLFADMTVLENLQIARAAKRTGDWNLASVLDALPQLKPILTRRAGQISGGQQQAAAIGRALMTNPRLLLLDELSLGLSPIAVDGVYAVLPRLIEAGIAIILVEQDLRRAMATANRLICMLEGQIVLQGPSASFTREVVTAAYFGLQRRAA